MGRKLTSYERSLRDRERESDRKERARVVAKRRDKARAEKERLLKGNISAAKKEVAKYENFYNSIVTLHQHSFGKTTFSSDFSKDLTFESKLTNPKKPTTYNFKPKQFIFKEKDVLDKLKKESEYDFKEYCNAEGKFSFILFVKLFGTENKYIVFKEKSKKKYEEINKKKQVDNSNHKVKDEKRKIDEQKEYDTLVNIYNNELKSYEKKLSDQKNNFSSEEKLRKVWYDKACNGDLNFIEEVCELMFPIEFYLDDEYQMLNPTESSIGYEVINQEKIKICVNLPSELNFLPELGLKMTTSDKSMSEFKISNKVRTEVADRVVCSLGFSYLKSIFNVLKSVNHISIEVGVEGVDPKTGGIADLIFLSMEVPRETYSMIKISNIDVIHAVENFDHKYRSTSTNKNIDGKIDRENLIWATDDDENIKLSKHIRGSFRSTFYK